MHKQIPAGRKPEGPKPKSPPRWRDLSDEEQWDQIYKGRELRKKSAPKSVAEATALCLPAYAIQMAIDDCHKTFQATVRYDVHIAVVSSIAKVSQMLPAQKREKMATRLQRSFEDIRKEGFYLNNREFLYAVAYATVKMVDDYRFPPDAPVTSAAILLKEDAERDDEGDWMLQQAHAMKMGDVAYDGFLKTGLYSYPDARFA